jgi:hypothetical protein
MMFGLLFKSGGDNLDLSFRVGVGNEDVWVTVQRGVEDG